MSNQTRIVKERPILFSAPMVRAILEGKKTQTRRIVKPQPVIREDGDYDWNERLFGFTEDGLKDVMTRCYTQGKANPYGVPGDEPWVRETWMEVSDPDTLKPSGRAIYRATHEGREPIRCDGDGFQVWNKDNSAASPWKPSIHMPRWASRISLVVKSVRVERLQDISQADAIAEGGPPSHPSIDAVSRDFGYADFSRSWYAQLWESINGEGSWDANPYVWVVEFERSQP